METASPEHSRAPHPSDPTDAGVFVGEIRALFAVLIESSIGAMPVPTEVSGSTEFHSGDLVVFIGENPPITGRESAHPAAAYPHGAEIIVVGFTPPETADAATPHYLIRPGTDLVLLHGLANILIASGWIDRADLGAHLAGFEEFAQFVTHFTTDIVGEATGLHADDLWHFAQTVADGKRVFFRWQMGIDPRRSDQDAFARSRLR